MVKILLKKSTIKGLYNFLLITFAKKRVFIMVLCSQIEPNSELNL